MKPEEQIKALAELDGITSIVLTDLGDWRILKPDGETAALPDYLHSYDAIVPLLQKQVKSLDISDKFFGEIEQPTGCTGEDLLSRTPAQLCEALLRATGKWQN